MFRGFCFLFPSTAVSGGKRVHRPSSMEYNDATQVIDDESEEDDGDAEQWAVVEMRDGGEEQSHPLFVDPGRTEDRFWIGRDASCEVTLDAASVSRRHAELVVRRTGVGEYFTFVQLDARFWRRR